MPLIVAIEPDRRQATQIGTIARGTLGAELVLADTTERALASLGGRVPDLILTSALLSPADESALAACLRRLDGSGCRVQTLTIPVLASGSKRKAETGTGVLSRLRKSSKKTHAPEGCDPQVFAHQITEYLERAETDRTTGHAEGALDYGAAGDVIPAPEGEAALPSIPEPVLRAPVALSCVVSDPGEPAPVVTAESVSVPVEVEAPAPDTVVPEAAAPGVSDEAFEAAPAAVAPASPEAQRLVLDAVDVFETSDSFVDEARHTLDGDASSIGPASPIEAAGALPASVEPVIEAVDEPPDTDEPRTASVRIDLDAVPPEWEEVVIASDATEPAEGDGDAGDELSALSAFELASFVNAAARAHFEIIEARSDELSSDVQAQDDFDISAFLDGLTPAERSAAVADIANVAPDAVSEPDVMERPAAEAEPTAVEQVATLPAAMPIPAEAEPLSLELAMPVGSPGVEAWAALSTRRDRSPWPALEGIPVIPVHAGVEDAPDHAPAVVEPEHEDARPAPAPAVAPVPDGPWSALLDALRHEVDLLRSERQRPAVAAPAPVVAAPPAAAAAEPNATSMPVLPAPVAPAAAERLPIAAAPVVAPAAATPPAPAPVAPEATAMPHPLAALDSDDAPPPSPQAVRAAREAVVRNVARKKRARKPQPAQDEWGFFDPEQCGFAALLAKLEEVTDEDVQANQPG